jgi:cysteine synthase A
MLTLIIFLSYNTHRLGAELHIVPACAISNANHYVNSARKLAASLGGFFVNQFENVANSEIHFTTTGPEIYDQARDLIRGSDKGQSDGSNVIDAFVMSSGTGGTIAGVSRCDIESIYHD